MTQFEQYVLPIFEQHRADWLASARSVARLMGMDGTPITIDMVRAKCPPPRGVDPRVMGAVFKRSEWENCGYVRGFRTASHARPVALFKLRNAS
jgi:hypothetical protein